MNEKKQIMAAVLTDMKSGKVVNRKEVTDLKALEVWLRVIYPNFFDDSAPYRLELFYI